MKKQSFRFILVVFMMMLFPVPVTAATQGWQIDENQHWYYLEKNVKVVGWHYINQNWYYFDNKGQMQTGWQFINQKWYYFTSSGQMIVGWQSINQNWYYFDSSGAMVTNWQPINNEWYFFDSSGKMLVGWQFINNEWYYLANSGKMLKNWQYINQNWYYFASNGAMVTGWSWIKDHWYYLDQSGAMRSGWLLLEDDWYYLGASGGMQTGWVLTDNHWYYLQGTGQWLENQTSQFIGEILSDSLMVTAKAQLFPSVMVAQASIESALGTSLLAKEANNYFGMKFKVNEDEGKYDVFYKETLEYDEENDEWLTVVEPFRKYASRLDSFNDYALKLRNGVSWDPFYYQGTWRENATDYHDVTAALQGKYATDPDYATKLNNFIEAWQLYKIDKE